MSGFPQKPIETALIDRECCGIYEGMESEFPDTPGILIHHYADSMMVIKDESEWCDGSRFHAEERFEVLGGGKAQSSYAERFA